MNLTSLEPQVGRMCAFDYDEKVGTIVDVRPSTHALRLDTRDIVVLVDGQRWLVNEQHAYFRIFEDLRFTEDEIAWMCSQAEEE